jgi:hypothetical protein
MDRLERNYLFLNEVLLSGVGGEFHDARLEVASIERREEDGWV